MSSNVMHACCISPANIDFNILECYLKGYEAEETVSFLMSRYKSTPVKEVPSRNSLAALNFSKQLVLPESFANGLDISTDFLLEEVADHYRVFRVLIKRDNYLRSPYAFLTNHYLPFVFADRLKIVSMYYDFESIIFRYFFGNKNGHSSVEFMLRDINIASKTSNGAPTDYSLGLRLQVQTIQDSVVKRQLENLKRVCSTITGMYHCKGDRFIPHDVQLTTAVEKCFGFHKPLSTYYAAAVFSYEHEFSSKILERFKTCDDCFTLYHLIAALWCDESGLFLKDDASAHWKSLARQLEDTKWLSDVHLELFGEPLRPRWQQQLDGGVQRVIGATSSAEKGGGAAKMEESVSVQGGTEGPAEQKRSPIHKRSPPSPIPSFGIHFQGGLSSTLVCANGKYSRRFCFEFASVMKACSKVASLLSAGLLNDALDYYYTRILHPLEQMSSRDAPDVFAFSRFTSPVTQTSGDTRGLRTSPSAPTIVMDNDTKKHSAAFQQSISEPSLDVANTTRMRLKAGVETDEESRVSSVVESAPPSGAPSITDTKHEAASPCFKSSLVDGWSAIPHKEKIYLVELCSLFLKLPQLWSKGSTGAEPKEREALVSLTVALRSITQLIISMEE